MSRTLVIGDLHEPCAHPGYLSFCSDLYEQEHCDDVVFIGDVVDWTAISFHTKHPSSPGPKDEYELALREVARWRDRFPQATVTLGNHDRRVERVAQDAGIPPEFIRSYEDLWDTPGWDWRFDLTRDGVYYFHGEGFGGQHPSFNAMRKMLMSVAIGHSHTAGGVTWLANPHRRIFSLDTGCGIDVDAAAFAYGRHLRQKPMLGAGIVLDGQEAHFVPLPCGRGEPYHKSKFRRSRNARSR